MISAAVLASFHHCCCWAGVLVTPAPRNLFQKSWWVIRNIRQDTKFPKFLVTSVCLQCWSCRCLQQWNLLWCGLLIVLLPLFLPPLCLDPYNSLLMLISFFLSALFCSPLLGFSCHKNCCMMICYSNGEWGIFLSNYKLCKQPHFE